MAVGGPNLNPVDLRKVPPRAPEMEGLGEYVIINEARVYREQSHEENDVSPAAYYYER